MRQEYTIFPDNAISCFHAYFGRKFGRKILRLKLQMNSVKMLRDKYQILKSHSRLGGRYEGKQ